MAGIGAAPKDKSARRHTAVPMRGEWVDLQPLEAPVLPELPEREDGWSAGARRLWDAWRVDPVTAQWTPADVAMAWDTIELRDRMRPSTANEVRLRMDGLGLTPKGKRDLRWRVSDETLQAPTPRPSGSKRRARLSIIE